MRFFGCDRTVGEAFEDTGRWWRCRCHHLGSGVSHVGCWLGWHHHRLLKMLYYGPLPTVSITPKKATALQILQCFQHPLLTRFPVSPQVFWGGSYFHTFLFTSRPPLQLLNPQQWEFSFFPFKSFRSWPCSKPPGIPLPFSWYLELLKVAGRGTHTWSHSPTSSYSARGTCPRLTHSSPCVPFGHLYLFLALSVVRQGSWGPLKVSPSPRPQVVPPPSPEPRSHSFIQLDWLETKVGDDFLWGDFLVPFNLGNDGPLIIFCLCCHLY